MKCRAALIYQNFNIPIHLFYWEIGLSQKPKFILVLILKKYFHGCIWDVEAMFNIWYHNILVAEIKARMPTSQWQSTNLNVKKEGGKGTAREQNKKK